MLNRGKVTKLAFAIVIVCFLLSTFVSFWSIRLMGRRSMQELSKSLAARIYDEINSELSEPTTVATTLVNDRFLIDFLKEESSFSSEEFEQKMSDYLTGIKEGLDYETTFVISDQSGNYYTNSGVIKQLQPETDSRDKWYTDFVRSGVAYGVELDRDTADQNLWTIYIDARIEDGDGQLLGVCGVAKHMSTTQELFEELEKEFNVEICLVDADGRVKIDTDDSLIGTELPDRIRMSAGDDYVYEQRGNGGYSISRYVDSLNWYLVIRSGGGDEREQYFNVIILNLILCGAILLILGLAIRIIMKRTRDLTNASFRDHSTGLYNRRAFEEEKAELEISGLPSVFVYVIADLNGLKKANDTIGHAAGDELIKGAADCMKKCFGRYGKIFRIGGDEFAMMLDISLDKLDGVRDEFEKMTSAWSGSKVDRLSVSCGYVSSKEFPSETISELSRIADERMYAAKEEYYRRTGEPHR